MRNPVEYLCLLRLFPLEPNYLSDVGSAFSLFNDVIDPVGAFGRKWDAIPNGALVLTP